MSISFSQGKLQADERKSIIQVVQKQAKDAALNAIRPVLMGFLEGEVTAKLGRAKGEPPQVSSAQRAIDWQCARCVCSDANQVTRDGHYRRNVETGWGHLEDLQVPMVECQQCQHDVICSFTILEQEQRFWLDVDQDVLFRTGWCQSLREISQRWSAIVGGSVGLRTINERINQIEPLLLQAHREPITDVPTVVQLDGIWLTIQSQTEKEKPERRKRRRKERKGQRVVVLVALGFWNDGSGGLGEALAFVYGSAVLEQRCLLHKLRNVADKARSELKGEEKRAARKQLRRKFRQSVTFGSRKGAEVAIYLQVQRLHAHWADESWWEVSHALYFDLWNLNP